MLCGSSTQDLWIIGIDSCHEENMAETITLYRRTYHRGATRKWIESIMERAKAEQKQVLPMMHHSLLEHFPSSRSLLESMSSRIGLYVARRLSSHLVH